MFQLEEILDILTDPKVLPYIIGGIILIVVLIICCIIHSKLTK